jgi:hypothetical protein
MERESNERQSRACLWYPAFVALSPDSAGLHWMLNIGVGAGVHGWIVDGRLVPLQPANGRIADEAW